MLFLFSRQFFIWFPFLMFVKNNVPEPWQMDKAFIMLLKHLFILYCDGKKQENLHRLAGRVAMKFSLCEKKIQCSSLTGSVAVRYVLTTLVYHSGHKDGFSEGNWTHLSLKISSYLSADHLKSILLQYFSWFSFDLLSSSQRICRICTEGEKRNNFYLSYTRNWINPKVILGCERWKH